MPPALTFQDGAAASSKQAVVLFEIDIGQTQDFFTNYSAGVWYVNFEATYPDIDSTLLVGVAAQDLTLIGSVAWDGVQLGNVPSIAAVEASPATFHSVGSYLYVSGPDRNSPANHSVIIGISIAMANYDRVFNGQVYESRIRSVPSISRSRDPVFFGKVSFDSGTVAVDNTDGRFDDYAEQNNVFGGAARLRLGFDESPYSEYRIVYKGFAENISIGRDRMSVVVQDNRKKLQRSVGTSTFNLTSHPDIDPDNLGRALPLAYGTLRNIPCVVTNELEDPGTTPTWTVQIADPVHSIDAITTVYVDGVAVTPASKNLTTATAILSNGDFAAGKTVTADITGYETSGGVVVSNALDVIKDLIVSFFEERYTGEAFDTVRWDAQTLLAKDVALFVSDATPVISLIEQVCDSIFGSFLVTDDGRYSFQIYNDPGASSVTLRLADLLEWSAVDYDPSEVLTSTEVAYHRDWASGKFRRLRDVSQEAALLGTVPIRREGTFETLLTTGPDAQSFSDTVLELSGKVRPTTRVSCKLTAPALSAAVGDFINVELNRPAADIAAIGGSVPNASTGIGFFYCEVLGRTMNLSAFEVELELRLIKAIGDPRPALVTTEEVYNATAEAEALYGDVSASVTAGTLYGGPRN